MIGKKLPTILFSILLGLAPGLAMAGEGVEFINDDLPLALAEAKKSGKPLMVDVFATWCGPCKMLDKQTFSDPKVREMAKNFVTLRLDGDKDTSDAFKTKYGVSGYPTVVFLNSKGEEIDRTVGFLQPKEFLAFMTDWKDGKNTFASLKKAYESDGANARAVFNYAQAAHRRNSGDDAAKLFARVADLDPSNKSGFADDAEFMAAINSFQSRDIAGARKHIETLIEKYPSSEKREDAFEFLLQFSQSARDVKGLVANSERFYEAYPTNSRAAYYYAAFSSEHAKDDSARLEKALKAIDIALSGSPWQLEMIGVKSDLLTSLNRVAEARKLLSDAMDRSAGEQQKQFYSQKLSQLPAETK